MRFPRPRSRDVLMAARAESASVLVLRTLRRGRGPACGAPRAELGRGLELAEMHLDLLGTAVGDLHRPAAFRRRVHEGDRGTTAPGTRPTAEDPPGARDGRRRPRQVVFGRRSRGLGRGPRLRRRGGGRPLRRGHSGRTRGRRGGRGHDVRQRSGEASPLRWSGAERATDRTSGEDAVREIARPVTNKSNRRPRDCGRCRGRGDPGERQKRRSPSCLHTLTFRACTLSAG